MKRLGYYAKDNQGNLFQFRWTSPDIFEIKFGLQWIESNPKEFEILEIGFFVSE